MLGIRLPVDAEAQLARYARNVGRAKSVIVREWIIERLHRESVDAEMRHAAEILAARTSSEELDELDRATDEWLRSLDEEDGGYDWGHEGPPN